MNSPQPPIDRHPGPDEVTVTVEAISHEARDVVSLTLVPTDGRSLPDWQPGAHIDLHLGLDRPRQYSLCGIPADRGR